MPKLGSVGDGLGPAVLGQGDGARIGQAQAKGQAGWWGCGRPMRLSVWSDKWAVRSPGKGCDEKQWGTRTAGVPG